MSKSKKQKYYKKIRNFKKGSRIIFSNQKRIRTFDYTYVSVNVRVYFDGFYTDVTGRSDYIKGKQIPNNEIPELIRIAVIRAIAPFGSNVNFKILDYNLAYYQDEFTVNELEHGMERPITTREI